MFITSPRVFAERFNEKIPDACRKITPMMCVVDHAEDIAEKNRPKRRIESLLLPDKPCQWAVPG
jgi:hypothetical protein